MIFGRSKRLQEIANRKSLPSLKKLAWKTFRVTELKEQTRGGTDALALFRLGAEAGSDAASSVILLKHRCYEVTIATPTECYYFVFITRSLDALLREMEQLRDVGNPGPYRREPDAEPAAT